MFLGIDIGSSSSKVAIIDMDQNILYQKAVNVGTGSNAIEKMREQALQQAGCQEKDVLYTVVTGYGRTTYKNADAQITEISCHAKGTYFLFPKARTVIDIGGQDSKVIRVGEEGYAEDFVMNDKCAAGTGRFLEVMARVLGCDIGTLSDVAAQAKSSVTISSTCTVFAESEVISQLSIGSKKEQVALGAHISVAKRVSGQAGRVGVLPDVVMTGGVALNKNMVKVLGDEIGYPILVPESPQTIGALGAALYARERYLQGKTNTK